MNFFRILPALAVLSAPFALIGAENSSGAAAEDCCAATPTCPVSGKELGSMGEPFVYVHKEECKPDREVRFCCKGCLPRFKKDPAQYLAKLDQAGECCAEGDAPAAKKDKSAPSSGHGHR
jgi:hypothetical protein